MNKMRGFKIDIRSAELLGPMAVGVLAVVVIAAGVAEVVVVELAAASAGVALTSPALEHRLNTLLLLPILVIEACCCVWAYMLQLLI